MNRKYIIVLVVSMLFFIGCSMEAPQEMISEEVDRKTESETVVLNEMESELDETSGDELIQDNELKTLPQENHEEIDKKDIDVKTTISPEAVDLNTKGFELYKKGKYEEALILFKRAIELDNNYFYPHFNYACTLGVLMKKDYPEWYSFKEEAIEHLKTVLELNPEYIDKVKSDPDLDILRSEFGYYKILGYKTAKTEDVETLLVNLNWYIRGLGVISVLGEINFKEDKTFEFSYYDLEGYNEGLADYSSIIVNGNYEIKGNIVKLVIDSPMLVRNKIDDYYNNFSEYDEQLIFEGTLSEDGVLKLNDFKYEIFNWYEEFSA